MYIDVENLAKKASAFMAYMPLYILERCEMSEMWDAQTESGKSSRIRDC